MRHVPFPTAREKLEVEAAEYRRASPDYRVKVMLELSLLSAEILASSPHRERQLRILDDNERLENECWRQLIERHVGREGTLRSP